MFRRERPQKGRYRQFYQIGAEAIGSESPAVDAEVIEMVRRDSERCGRSTGFASADQLRRLRRSAARASSTRCASSCRSVGARMCARLPAARRDQSAARARLQGAEATSRSSTRCPRSSTISATPCRAHFDAVRALARRRAASTYEVRPRLVRGLDYYTRTTFEVTHGALGAQNSDARRRPLRRTGGIARLARCRRPGIGFSIGEDRLVMTIEEQ